MALFDTMKQMWRKPTLDEDGVSEDGIPRNPSGKEFLDAAKSSIRKTIDRFSVTQSAIEIGSAKDGNANRVTSPFGSAGIVNPGSDVDTTFSTSTLGLAVPVETNKLMRIQSYDNIARYPELEWCINEIANDFIHEDIEGKFIKLRFTADEGKYGEGADSIIEEEFRHFISNFDLKSNGYNMMRKFLIEGEICFENVIDPNHPEYGIIGAKYIPNVFYDFLRDRRTGQTCGLYINPDSMKMYMQSGSYTGGSNTFNGQSTTVFNAVRQLPGYTFSYSQDMKDKIVLPWEQVTYMNSGVLSEDGAIVFPHIEKVVVPVRQLLLMHDAMVILRITRAPEKLLFNIDMTGLQPREARNYVRKFVEQRRSKKAVVGSGTVTNVYNAETMLDAYYFWKTSESAGTTVTNLNSNATHYNELHDVEYFLHRILKFLNIPWQRWAESSANRQDKNSIMNEEFSFAKMEVRFQQMFSSAIKKSFITHLRLRELFEKFDMNESDFEVVMVAPALYENYQAEQRFSDFLDIMSKTTGLEFMSKNSILKKIFGWTESDIKDNEVNVRREALYKAQTDFMVQQVSAQGTPTAGRVWLDPEKYINPPPSNPTGTDVNGGAPMPPPGGNPPDGGAPAPMPPDGGMPPPAAPEGVAPDGGMPPPDGGMPQPDMSAPQGIDNPENELKEIPEPEVPDDSGTTSAERNSRVNPDFGDFENRERNSNVDFKKHYPETDLGVEALEKDRELSLKDIFDKTVGQELDSKKKLSDIFKDEFGTGRKRYLKNLKSIFDKEFGDELDDMKKGSGEPASLSSLSSVFKDAFLRKKPKSLKSVFKNSLT